MTKDQIKAVLNGWGILVRRVKDQVIPAGERLAVTAAGNILTNIFVELDTPLTPHPDITRSHHHGNQFSVMANPDAAKKAEDMELILAEFRTRGEYGCIREDAYLTAGFDNGDSTGAARCTDLAAAGAIQPVWNPDGTQARRPGIRNPKKTAGVWCAAEYAKPRPVTSIKDIMPDEDEL